jgi:hypothetical protein
MKSADGVGWLSRVGRQEFNADATNWIAHTDLIVDLIVAAMVAARNKPNFAALVDKALNDDARLDTNTGALDPQPAIIGALTHRFFSEDPS